MEADINGEWLPMSKEQPFSAFTATSIAVGRCLRLACTRRVMPVVAGREGHEMADGPDDDIAYWRGTIDARILLVDRVLQDMQAQIRQLSENMGKMQELLRQDMQAQIRQLSENMGKMQELLRQDIQVSAQDMQVSAVEARVGNRWTYMIVGGGVLLAALLPFLLPLLVQGRRP